MEKPFSIDWKLSAFYFFYFVVFGVYFPYWPLYLKSIGFSVAAIGELTAIFIGASVVSPLLLAWASDHTGNNTRFLRLGAILSLLSFAVVLVEKRFLALAFSLGVFGFFWYGLLPQLETYTLNHVGARKNQYGMIRLWGSCGFLAAALVFGQILQYTPIAVVPVVILLLLILIALLTLVIPDNAIRTKRRDESNLITICKRPMVRLFLITVFLIFLSFAPYIAFFSIHLEKHHYRPESIGGLWALGAIAQTAAFFMLPRLLSFFSFKALLHMAYATTFARWLFISFYADNVYLVSLSQLLGAGAGIYHVAVIHIVNAWFMGTHQTRGQAIYVCTGSAASVIGVLLTGYAWERYSGHTCFLLAALSVAIAALMTYRYLADNDISLT